MEQTCVRCNERPVANRPGAKICDQCFLEAMDNLFAEAAARSHTITGEQLEKLGELSDKADNLIAASMLPVSPRIHIDALRTGLKEIRDMLRIIYVEIGDDDPWEDNGAAVG